MFFLSLSMLLCYGHLLESDVCNYFTISLDLMLHRINCLGAAFCVFTSGN